jgi:hypothetical protein
MCGAVFKQHRIRKDENVNQATRKRVAIAVTKIKTVFKKK